MQPDMNVNFTEKIRGAKLNEYIEYYRQLAMAVVGQAVKDYREALVKYKNAVEFWNTEEGKRKVDSAKGEIRSLEKFFHSGRYGILTDIDPDILIQKVRSMEGIDENEEF